MRSLAIPILLASAAAAQGPSDPPPLLQIIRLPTGSRSERPYQSARAAVDVVGIASMTGLSETWLIEAHQNFASIEDLDLALRANATAGPSNQFGEARPADEMLGSPRTLLATYQPSYSYRPGEATRNLPKARYFRVSIYRVRPGTTDFMSFLQSQRRRDYNDVNLDRSELAYRVISGAPASTYLILAPLTSLRQIDDGLLRLPSYLEPAADQQSENALGWEHLLFRVDPQISYVSPGFAGGDAEYWKPRRQ
jgi:hypothetical protein